MIRPRNETENSLFSININCETLIKQTHRKAEEIIEFKLTKPREVFSFNPSINLGLVSNWMLGLINSEFYKSILNIKEENSTFGLYADFFNEFSIAELKDEPEQILKISNNTPKHLQDKIIGRRIFLEYEILEREKRLTDYILYYIIL